MTAKYDLPTIGGMFATSDHDRFLTVNDRSQFDMLFPLKVGGKTRNLYETGIDALAAILRDQGAPGAPIRLWTPENFCQESLQRLNLKLDQRLQFVSYRSTSDLWEIQKKEVLLWLHFNRFDLAAKSTIEALKERVGVIVIEDFVQAPLDISRFSGDFALNSLRKFSSLDVSVAYQDGVARTESEIQHAKETRYRVLKKEAEHIKSAFLQCPSEELERQFLSHCREADQALFVREIAHCHPREEERAAHFDFRAVRERRTANYRWLAAQFDQHLDEMTILPGDLMYLMVTTADRDRYRADLMAQRVFPVIHWSDSGSLLAKSLLSFHVDQRYTVDDFQRMISVLKATQDDLRRLRQVRKGSPAAGDYEAGPGL
jgi:hypothetical protein